MKRNSKNTEWRFPKRIFPIFLFCFVILYIQYAYLALSPTIYGINMKEFAEQRNTVKTTLTAKRGTIYDKEGDILALNISSYTVIAYLDSSRTTNEKYPQHVVDKDTTAEKLSTVLGMSEEYIRNLLDNEAYQVELGPGGRGITELEKEAIEDLNLPGIDFIESYKRYYPNGDFASYTIGYAKEDEEGNISGELGIEAKYDEMLKGTDGYLEYQQDKYGYKIPDTNEIRNDAKDGNDIYLTIDASIQRFIEGALKEAEAEYTPEWMLMTVMDAQTGDILGTASTPSFDPNIRDLTNYENPLVTYLYEPGSTMKIYTYMCAMEKGTYDGNATFQSGSLEIGEDVISDWNRTGWGTITFDKGFQFSSNVAVATMMQNYLTKNELKECLIKYGFTETTDIELPREQAGMIKFNYPIEVATASFGQGINITAIEQLQALTIIANDGKMLKPHIIDKIVDPNTDEIVYESLVEESEQIVSQNTVNKIKELMYNTVHGTDSGTTGRAFNIEGFDVIAKTGTSQIYDEQNGGYLQGTNDYIYSVAGMFPKDNPEIIIYTVVKRPTWGTTQAMSNATVSVIKSIAKYKNMFTDKIEGATMTELTLPSYTNKTLDEVKTDLNAKGVETIVIGNGNKIINQYPKAGDTVISYDKVILVTNEQTWKIPNLTGWSRVEVIALCNLLNVTCEFEGYGYVESQSINANTAIKAGDKIQIKLKEKFDINITNTKENKNETEETNEADNSDENENVESND